jgi:hypothetical protein
MAAERRIAVPECRPAGVLAPSEFFAVNCHELAARLSRLEATASPVEIARLCLLLYNNVPDCERLNDQNYLVECWGELSIRLHSAIDQHEAVTDELEQLAKSDPRQFTPEQIWVLVRAIKVQGQLLRLYSGQAQTETV